MYIFHNNKKQNDFEPLKSERPIKLWNIFPEDMLEVALLEVFKNKTRKYTVGNSPVLARQEQMIS